MTPKEVFPEEHFAPLYILFLNWHGTSDFLPQNELVQRQSLAKCLSGEAKILQPLPVGLQNEPPEIPR